MLVDANDCSKGSIWFSAICGVLGGAKTLFALFAANPKIQDISQRHRHKFQTPPWRSREHTFLRERL